MKKIRFAVCFGMIFAVLLSMARFDALCEDLRNNVFRLHIIANSDSSSDQALKLKVRDEILKLSECYFKNCENSEQAELIAANNINELKRTAEKVIKENGKSYPVSVSVSPSYFENRKYKDFTLPAGEYSSLNIKIGEANGKNWWCVMFPAVCIGPSCKLSDGVGENSAYIAEHPAKYEIRFKTVEVYEDLKKFLKK